jgi:membrane protease YdiL (CAAX protease family)
LILRKEWKAELFWSYKRLKPAPVLLGVTLGASSNLFFVGVMNFLPIPEDIAQQPFEELFDGNVFVMLASIAIVAAVTEEIIFRGIILKRLLKVAGIPVAIILQAFIFAFIHMNLFQGSYAFVLGLIIGTVYLWHDSIWIPITVHFVFNGTSVMLDYIAGEVEISPTGLIIMTVVAFVVSAGSMIELYRRRLFGKEQA